MNLKFHVSTLQQCFMRKYDMSTFYNDN